MKYFWAVFKEAFLPTYHFIVTVCHKIVTKLFEGSLIGKQEGQQIISYLLSYVCDIVIYKLILYDESKYSYYCTIIRERTAYLFVLVTDMIREIS